MRMLATAGLFLIMDVFLTQALSITKSMSYQVLARKWRPRTFEEMVGQEFAQAVQALAQKHMILLAVETNYTEELQQELSTDIIYRLVGSDSATKKRASPW